MKFTGMHLHLILVAAVICVVLYVFYISRDIVLIDKEVKALHDRLDILMKASPPSATSRPMNVVNAKPMPNSTPMVGGAPYPRPTPAPVTAAPVSSTAQAAPEAPRQPPASSPPVAPKHTQRVTFVSDDDDDTEDETEDMVSDDMSSSIDIQAHVVKMEADDDDSQSDTTDKLKQMLDAVDTPVVPPPSPAPAPASVPAVPGFESLSWAEIKDRCKKLNISIRGSTKDQLIHKLKEVSSAT
jgi:hypothetical protein